MTVLAIYKLFHIYFYQLNLHYLFFMYKSHLTVLSDIHHKAHSSCLERDHNCDNFEPCTNKKKVQRKQLDWELIYAMKGWPIFIETEIIQHHLTSYSHPQILLPNNSKYLFKFPTLSNVQLNHFYVNTIQSPFSLIALQLIRKSRVIE